MENLLNDINEPTEKSKTNEVDNNKNNKMINDNKLKEDIINMIKTKLNNQKFLLWKENSCSFNSFLCIFLYSIKPILELEDNANLYNKTKKNNAKFCLFIIFIELINNNNFKKKLYTMIILI